MFFFFFLYASMCVCVDPGGEELPRCIPNPAWRFSVCMSVLYVLYVCIRVYNGGITSKEKKNERACPGGVFLF